MYNHPDQENVMEEILNRHFSISEADGSDLEQILEDLFTTQEDKLGCPNNYTAIEGSSMLCVRVFSSAMFNETKSNSTVRSFTLLDFEQTLRLSPFTVWFQTLCEFL